MKELKHFLNEVEMPRRGMDKKMRALLEPTVTDGPNTDYDQNIAAVGKDHTHEPKSEINVTNYGDEVKEVATDPNIAEVSLDAVYDSWNALPDDLDDESYDRIVSAIEDLQAAINGAQGAKVNAGSYDDNRDNNWGSDVTEDFVPGNYKHNDGTVSELSKQEANILNGLIETLSKHSAADMEKRAKKSRGALLELIDFANSVVDTEK